MQSKGIAKESQRMARTLFDRGEKKVAKCSRGRGEREIKKKKREKKRNGRTVKNLGIRRCNRVRSGDLQNPEKGKSVCERDRERAK